MTMINSQQTIYSFKPDMEPVASIDPGSVVTFETLDCFGNQIKDENQPIDSIDWHRINPATGPVYVKGAQPGDSLKVSILQIEVANHGVMAAIPDCGVLGAQVKKSEIRRIPIKENMAYFCDIPMEIKPMVGVIGLAPRAGEIPCGTPGPHGGNLDTNLVCPGNAIILPVQVPGALLAMGDIHARMGDGEVWVTGIEAAAKVTVRIEVLKNIAFPEPVIINDQIAAFLSSAETLDEAVEKATQYAVDCLVQLGMAFNDAGMLLSAIADLQISQVVDPLKTVRIVIPRYVLTKLGFQLNL